MLKKGSNRLFWVETIVGADVPTAPSSRCLDCTLLKNVVGTLKTSPTNLQQPTFFCNFAADF